MTTFSVRATGISIGASCVTPYLKPEQVVRHRTAGVGSELSAEH